MSKLKIGCIQFFNVNFTHYIIKCNQCATKKNSFKNLRFMQVLIANDVKHNHKVM